MRAPLKQEIVLIRNRAAGSAKSSQGEALHRLCSSLGGIVKDIDLFVAQPLTGQRMALQVKSAATKETFFNYRIGLI